MKEISKQLFKKFIYNDDKHLLKLIKKILIIYKRFHTKLLQSKFHEWQIITLKINDDLNNNKNKIINVKELHESHVNNKSNLYNNNKMNNNLKNYNINNKNKKS